MTRLLMIMFLLLINNSFANTASFRNTSFGTAMVGYEFLSSWIPSKKVVSYTQIINQEWSVELEYGWGNISAPFFLGDIGKITERRYSALGRYYFGRNSFNFVVGAVHNNFYTDVGQRILDNVSNKEFDVVQVKGTGVVLGLSNRWQYSNGFTVGVEWFRMNVPLFDRVVDAKILNYVQSERDRKNIQSVIDNLRNIPTFVLLGVNLGYTF